MKKNIYAVDTVIFDMDGVITDTMPFHYRAWKYAFKQIGIDIPRLEVYQKEGQTGYKVLKEIFDTYGVSYTRQKAENVLRTKESCFKKIVLLKFVPGSRRFLKKLSKESFKLALVTGTSRKEVLKILTEKILRFFDVVVTSNDVLHGKPHPQPYLKALTLLSSSKKRSLVIENAPLGVLSAKKAGLRCLALATSLPKEYLCEADGIFSSFADLDKKIKLINTARNEDK